MALAVKRIYEPYAEEDGYRVLVDRLWPRGVRKENAHIDLWLQDVAPSTALRQWFAHELEKWEAFRKLYHEELDANPRALQPLLAALKRGTVTLLYSAQDEQHNQAVALRDYVMALGDEAASSGG